MATTQPRGGQILDQTIKLDTPNQDVTGTLPVGNGGTGNATNTLNSLLVGNGTGALLALAPSTAGQVAVSTGSAWASSSSGVVLTDPKINAVKDTNGAAALDITATPSAVNRFQINNGPTGTGPAFIAVGPDTNLNITVYPQGAGTFVLSGQTGGVTPTILGYNNVDTNNDLNLQAKGTGVIRANNVDILGGSKLVQDAAYVLTAAYGKYFPDYAEISAGIAFEIGAGSVMEIG